MLKCYRFEDIELLKLCSAVIRQTIKPHKNTVPQVILERLGHYNNAESRIFYKQ